MVWVVGQVRQVGPQEIAPNQPMTVSQIILRAGGFGDFADQRKVKIIHRANLNGGGDLAPSDGSDAQIVDVKAVFDGQSRSDPVVRPNDYIIVPKRLVNF
jgi:protein involved in polysaccharide export with SLBB domain